MFLFFQILLALSMYFHRGDTTSFTLTEQEGTLHLKTTLGEEMVFRAIPELELTNDTTHKILKTYLNEHIKVTINEEPTSLDLITSFHKSGHYYIDLKILANKMPACNIKFSNSCFFEINPQQMNILEVRLSNADKDFLTSTKNNYLNIEL